MDDPALLVVRRCYEAIAARDLGSFVGVLAPECIMHEAGDGVVPHAGAYRGKAEIAGVFRRLSELSGGSGRFELQHLFSNGAGQVISIHRNLGSRPDGRSLDTQEALLFTVEDGLVTSVRNFYDDFDDVAAFWTDGE